MRAHFHKMKLTDTPSRVRICTITFPSRRNSKESTIGSYHPINGVSHSNPLMDALAKIQLRTLVHKMKLTDTPSRVRICTITFPSRRNSKDLTIGSYCPALESLTVIGNLTCTRWLKFDDPHTPLTLSPPPMSRRAFAFLLSQLSRWLISRGFDHRLACLRINTANSLRNPFLSALRPPTPHSP